MSKSHSMSKKLYLVLYDFTPVSEKALAYALHLGKSVEIEIKLVHLAENRAIGMAKLKQLNNLIQKTETPRGVKLTQLVKIGDIFSRIGKVVKEEKPQLIIMGTHGMKGTQWLFGSFALKLLQSTECPFLIVQKKTKIEDIDHISVPIDLSKESMQIANIAGSMAKIMKANLTVLTEKQSDPILNTRILNRLGIIQKEYDEMGVKATTHFVIHKGKYENKILKHAEENNVGLIALAYHSESLLPQFDTFTQELITNETGLPVLIINSKLASSLYF